MGKYNGISDEELLVRLKDDENEITDFLMEKYKNLVKKRAKAMFLIGGDNDDLIQEGMIGLFKAIRDFNIDKESSFQNFAQLCVSRQMYSAIKASQRKKHKPLNTYISFYSDAYEDEEGNMAIIDTMDSGAQANPESMLIAQENLDMINQKIQEKLSDFENKVVNLYIEGLNYQEIGRKLNKSSKSIDNALQRVKNKLQGLYIEI